MFVLFLYGELMKSNLFSKIAKSNQLCDSVSGGYSVYGKNIKVHWFSFVHSFCGS